MDLISSHRLFGDTGEVYIGCFLFKIQRGCIKKNNRKTTKKELLFLMAGSEQPIVISRINLLDSC